MSQALQWPVLFHARGLRRASQAEIRHIVNAISAKDLLDYPKEISISKKQKSQRKRENTNATCNKNYLLNVLVHFLRITKKSLAKYLAYSKETAEMKQI